MALTLSHLPFQNFLLKSELHKPGHIFPYKPSCFWLLHNFLLYIRLELHDYHFVSENLLPQYLIQRLITFIMFPDCICKHLFSLRPQYLFQIHWIHGQHLNFPHWKRIFSRFTVTPSRLPAAIT